MGFTTSATVVHELMEARDEGGLLNLQRQLSRLNLLIIDELGFVPLSRPGRNCPSRSSFSATSEDPYWCPPTCPSTSGPRSSVQSASPERCWTSTPQSHNFPAVLTVLKGLRKRSEKSRYRLPQMLQYMSRCGTGCSRRILQGREDFASDIAFETTDDLGLAHPLPGAAVHVLPGPGALQSLTRTMR